MSETVICSEAEMLGLGRRLASYLRPPMVVYLQGPLGAGKTTFVRGILQGLGYLGSVKSPTYTIVEPYELAGVTLYHFDLYRLTDPEELEGLGIRDYLSANALCLIEWPERGDGFLPAADAKLVFSYQTGESSTRRLAVSGLNLAEALSAGPEKS